MNIGNVFLGLILDDSDFEKQVTARAQKAGDKAGLSMGQSMVAGISRGATQIGTTLAGVGKNLTTTGRALTTNLTLPILAAGGATAKLALDFDTTLRQISGLTDVTADELDGVRDKILALAPAVGKGPQELAEAFYFIASAGFKAEEAMEVLETSAKAAASGLGETKTIAQVLGGVINAYGRENISAAKAADILTEAVSQGTAEASGLANVIGNVVPGAAALGVSFDQVTAAMAGMTLTGVGVEESATSLIQIFSSLQKPTVQAEEALKGLGLSSAELRRQLREEGLLATLRTLEERFQGNETAAAAVFGNIRALRGVTALLTLDSEQLNQVFGKVADSAGRLATAYEETEGPQREIDRAMADIQATAIELGADVLPIVVDVLKQLAAGARELAKWWRSLDDGTKRQVVQMLALAAVIGPLLLVFGKLVSVVGALFKTIGFLSGAKGIPALIKNFGKLGLIGALVGVALALQQAEKAAAGFFDELFNGKKAAQQLKDLEEIVGHPILAKQLRDWGVSVERFNELVEAAGGDATKAFRAISDASGDTTKALGSLRVEAGQLVDDRSFEEWDRRAQRALHGVTETAEDVPQELAATLENGQFVVGPAAEVMVDPIDEALQKAVEDAGTRAKEIVSALLDGLTGDRETFKQQVEDFVEEVTHPYKDMTRRVDIEAVLASKAVRDGLRSQDSQVQAETYELVTGLLAQYETLAPGALAAGALVNPAFEQGINANLDALVQWVQDNVTGQITDQFKLADVLQAAGYEGLAAYVRGQEVARKTKLFTELNATRKEINTKLNLDLRGSGFQIGSTLADGINASRYLVTKAALRTAGEIRALLRVGSEPESAQSPLRGITKWGGNLVRTLAEGMVSATREATNASAAIGQALLPQVGTMAPAFAGMPLPTAGVAALYGAAEGAGGSPTTVNNTWVLTVNGVPYEFHSRDDFIKALDDLAGFGGSGGRVSG